MIDSAADNSASTGKFKRKFFAASLAIGVALIVMVVGGYFLLKKQPHEEPGRQVMATVKPATEIPAVAQRPKQADTVPEQPVSSPNVGASSVKFENSPSLPAADAPPTPAVEDAGNYEAQRRIVMDKIRDFEKDAISMAHAVHVRVETPSIMAWSRSKPDAVAPEEAFRAHGYIAFVPSPDAFRDGMDYTMGNIADAYFRTFPGAPSVKVSLVIGNSVRSQKIFQSRNPAG